MARTGRTTHDGPRAAAQAREGAPRAKWRRDDPISRLFVGSRARRVPRGVRFGRRRGDDDKASCAARGDPGGAPPFREIELASTSSIGVSNAPAAGLSASDPGRPPCRPADPSSATRPGRDGRGAEGAALSEGGDGGHSSVTLVLGQGGRCAGVGGDFRSIAGPARRCTSSTTRGPRRDSSARPFGGPSGACLRASSLPNAGACPARREPWPLHSRVCRSGPVPPRCPTPSPPSLPRSPEPPSKGAGRGTSNHRKMPVGPEIGRPGGGSLRSRRPRPRASSRRASRASPPPRVGPSAPTRVGRGEGEALVPTRIDSIAAQGARGEIAEAVVAGARRRGAAPPVAAGRGRTTTTGDGPGVRVESAPLVVVVVAVASVDARPPRAPPR